MNHLSEIKTPAYVDAYISRCDEKIHSKPSDVNGVAVIPVDDGTLSDQAEKSTTIRLFGIDMAWMSSVRRFILLSSLIMVLYLIYGYVGEYIFRVDGFKPFGWYLTLIQFALTCAFGYAEQRIVPNTERKIPIATHALIAFLTVASMGLSNASIGYLNYPTHVIFKCCKLIPVLIGGICIQGKHHPLADWVACILMSVGLIFFTLADNVVQPNFDIYGVIIVVLSLFSDAVIGNIQEKAMRQHVAANTEVIVYSYGIGFVLILIGQLLSGQLFTASIFCLQNPVETYGCMFIFSVTGFFGLKVVLTLVQTSGALIAVMVTTIRKVFTIVLSFIIFTKPFTEQYIWSSILIISGIYIHVKSQNRSS